MIRGCEKALQIGIYEIPNPPGADLLLRVTLEIVHGAHVAEERVVHIEVRQRWLKLNFLGAADLLAAHSSDLGSHRSPRSILLH